MQLPFGDVTDDLGFLHQTKPPEQAGADDPLALVDLFSGCGGMSVGFLEAARRVRRSVDVRLAADSGSAMVHVYRRNMPRARAVVAKVETLFDGTPGSPMSRMEKRLAGAVGELDVLLGGPPCQGHSDLNNRTRRTDSRNRLYFRMARAAEVLEPSLVVVENVPAVRHDRSGVVDDTRSALENAGFTVHEEVVDLQRFGVPQRRRRHLLLALREGDPRALLHNSQSQFAPRTVRWAIEDLVDAADGAGMAIDTAATPTSLNKARIDYLFDNDLFDLPDARRPACHQDGKHSYNAVYGRLSWDAPAPTITTGFRCMGQGRYVHPSKRRTLTAHEAARLQSFPDWFEWGDTRPTHIATMIGNAVPPLVTLRIGEAYLAKRSRPPSQSADGDGPLADVQDETA